jgi:hypothetical protein
MSIELEPKRDIIIARLIDMKRTESGLHLPDTEQVKGATIFALVEKIGPDVKSCKPGDVVLPFVINHCWLKGGTYHRAVIKDEAVVASVRGLDPSTIRFVDEHLNGGGPRLVTAAP